MWIWIWIVVLSSEALDDRLTEFALALDSRHPATRRVAVRSLAEIGSTEAWELILPCLGDSSGEVADEAQWVLPRMERTDLLLGREGLRARDPLVRVRVAELLGRCPGPVEGVKLAKHMTRREPDHTAALAWSLERLARADALSKDVARCEREVARAVRFGGQAGAASLLCLEALNSSELEPELQRAANGRDELLRAAAAEALVRRAGLGDWSRVTSLAQDEDPGVRRALVEALNIAPDCQAAILCVERLGLEAVPTIRVRILHLLRSWSGLRHRYDPRPWLEWAAALPSGWTPIERSGPVAPLGTTTFAGISVCSDRLSILVDLSGSIHTTMEGGLTRREYVELELERLLMALPRTARFNIIGFCDEPHVWSEELVENRRGKAVQAMKWFRGLSVRGKGDLFAAAELALEDPDVDTLLVFTDGVATGGRRWKLELMALLLEQECRFRGVSLDSVLVDASARTVRCWQEISERTGGHSTELKITDGTERASGG